MAIKKEKIQPEGIHFAKHADMRLRYFGPATPTSTTVEVKRLAGPDFMIEVDAIAVVD